MITKKSEIHILLAVIITSVLVTAAIVSNCQGDDSAEEPNQPPKKHASKDREPPVIIWFHNGVYDSTEALKTTLSSGLVTHVMIKYMHRADASWRKKIAVRQAIEITKKSNAELIWCRNLWPYYNNKGVTEDTIFDPNYYINEIQQLRSEAKTMGAQYTAFDMEAYGYSPLQKCKLYF